MTTPTKPGRTDARIDIASLQREAEQDEIKTLFLFGGQSNMLGRDPATLDPVNGQQRPAPGIYMLDEAGSVTKAKYPFTRNGEQVELASPVYFFSKLARSYGIKPIIGSGAVGGTGLLQATGGRWYAPDGGTPGGDLFEDLLARANACLSDPNQRVRLGGMFWSQGAFDVGQGTSATEYVAELDKMLAELRDRLVDDEFGTHLDMPFVVNGWPEQFYADPALGATFQAYRDALRQWVARTPNTAFVEGGATELLPDGVHIDAEGQNRMVKRWADALREAMGNRVGAFAKTVPGETWDPLKTYYKGAKVTKDGALIRCGAESTGPGFVLADWVTEIEAASSKATYWVNVPNQVGMNLSFNQESEAMGYFYWKNLRYAMQSFEISAPTIPLDANGFPQVPIGESAQGILFTGMGVTGVVLDGPEHRRMENVYKPGTYQWEVSTVEGVANPIRFFGGDNAGSMVQTQVGAPGVPAIYQVTIPEASRSNAGTSPFFGNDSYAVNLSDLRVFRVEDAALFDENEFDPNYIKDGQLFSRLRKMEEQWENENALEVDSLDKLTTMDSFTWAGKGMPVEVYIEFCNQCQADPHYNIPANLCNDVVAIRAIAKKFAELLDPRLRVFVGVSNEIWNGAGNSGESPAFVFQSIHAVDLGYLTPGQAALPAGQDPATFIGRLNAQAHLSNQAWDIFYEEFGSSAADRVVRTLEHQNIPGNVPDLMEFEWNGVPMWQRLESNDFQQIGSYQTAPYAPNGLDATDWGSFDYSNPSFDESAFFLGVFTFYAQERDSAIAGLEQVHAAIRVYSDKIVHETYEGFWQDGKSFADNYDAQQQENMLVGVARLKSLGLFRDHTADLGRRVHEVLEGGCATVYGLYKRPSYPSGNRGLSIEPQEPYIEGDGTSYTGPFGPREGIEAFNVRTDGEVPTLAAEGPQGKDGSAPFILVTNSTDEHEYQVGDSLPFGTLQDTGVSGHLRRSRVLDPDPAVQALGLPVEQDFFMGRDNAIGTATGTANSRAMLLRQRQLKQRGELKIFFEDLRDPADYDTVVATGGQTLVGLLAADRTPGAPQTAVTEFGEALLSLEQSYWGVRKVTGPDEFSRYGLEVNQGNNNVPVDDGTGQPVLSDAVLNAVGIIGKHRATVRGEIAAVLKARGTSLGPGMSAYVGVGNGLSLFQIASGDADYFDLGTALNPFIGSNHKRLFQAAPTNSGTTLRMLRDTDGVEFDIKVNAAGNGLDVSAT